MFSTCIELRVVVFGLLVGDLTFGVESVNSKLSAIFLGDSGETVEAGKVEVGVVAEVSVTAGDGLVDLDCGSVRKGYNNDWKKREKKWGRR